MHQPHKCRCPLGRCKDYGWYHYFFLPDCTTFTHLTCAQLVSWEVHPLFGTRCCFVLMNTQRALPSECRLSLRSPPFGSRTCHSRRNLRHSWRLSPSAAAIMPLCCSLNHSSRVRAQGCVVSFSRPAEPSDINWKHFQVAASGVLAARLHFWRSDLCCWCWWFASPPPMPLWLALALDAPAIWCYIGWRLACRVGATSAIPFPFGSQGGFC